MAAPGVGAAAAVVIHGILLAAGAARRFGGDKLVQPLPDGTPLLVAALRRMRGAVDELACVVRPGDERVGSILRQESSARVIICAEAERGMAHSLGCGMHATAMADGWIIALADMPAVRPATHFALAQQLRAGADIVVPYYHGERGNPVAFSRKYRAALLALTGDSGARSLLEAHAGDITRLDVDDPGVLKDVDTPDDLKQL